MQTQKDAKEKCELNTNKICGVIVWGAVMQEGVDKVAGCFAQATATVVRK